MPCEKKRPDFNDSLCLQGLEYYYNQFFAMKKFFPLLFSLYVELRVRHTRRKLAPVVVATTMHRGRWGSISDYSVCSCCKVAILTSSLKILKSVLAMNYVANDIIFLILDKKHGTYMSRP